MRAHNAPITIRQEPSMTVASLVGLALFTASLTNAQDSTARVRAATTTVIAVAPADAQWISVKPENWSTESPSLEGKYVEVSGAGILTQMFVDRKRTFSNNGSLVDADGKRVGTVLFDQAADSVIAWMHRAKCNLPCQGVFVRGIPVYVDIGGPVLRERVPKPRAGVPVLRVIEVSYQSRAGVAAAGAEALAIPAADPGANKPLLPSGAVPNHDATAAAGTAAAKTATPQAVTDTATTDTAKKKSGGLLGMLKAVGGSVKVNGGGVQRNAGPAEGSFRYGDPPLLTTYYRNIRDTELNRIFANAQWNVGHTDWPRVALVVEEFTQGGLISVWNTKIGADVRNRCWRLSATLWTGPGASKAIPSFDWCLTEMHYDSLPEPGGVGIRTARIGIAQWGMTPKTSMMDQNTGPQRTLGPNPPYTPVMRFHFADDASTEAVMLGNVLRDMAFTYGVPDGRVWVVSVPGK